MTKLSEIQLKITETEDTLITEPCICEFCGRKIQFARCKRWINDSDEMLVYELPFKFSNLHICQKRPTSWAKLAEIPRDWEYDRPDNDDQTACFITKKYTKFDK